MIVESERIDQLVNIFYMRLMVDRFVLGTIRQCSQCMEKILKKILFLKGKIYTMGWPGCSESGTCRCRTASR